MNTSNRCCGMSPTVIVLAVLLIAGIIYHFMTMASLTKRLENLQAEVDQKQTAQPVNSINPEPTTPTETAKPAKLSSYTNNAFDYTLSYPDQYEVKVYSDKRATIGTITGTGTNENVAGKVYLSVVSAENAEDKQGSLEDFIFNKTKLLCDADGRGISRSCPRQKSLEPIKLASGLPAYALTLVQEDKVLFPEASTTESDVVFYIVNLGTDSKRTILILNTLEDGTDAMTKDVAMSVKR